MTFARTLFETGAERRVRVGSVVPRRAETDRHPLLQLQRLIGNRSVQRTLAAGEETLDRRIAPELVEEIERARAGGEDLAADVRIPMESVLGADLGGVRVHRDAASDGLAQRLSARAFTTGPDIFFRAGAYEPRTGTGLRLLAHELIHVLQQAGSAVRRELELGAPRDACEHEADRMAETVAAGAESIAPAGVAGCRDCGDVRRQQAPPEEPEGLREKAAMFSEERLRQDEEEERRAAQVAVMPAPVSVQRACQHFPDYASPDTYCETMAEAQALPTRACPPDDADFIYGDGPPTHRWRRVPGFGCAHYVAHRLNIRNGPQWARCRGGFSVTIDQVTEGRVQHGLVDAQVNDVWSSGTHSGVVIEVDAANARVRVNQCGVGGVVQPVWFNYGNVYR
jgi:Domain of unknown function (DUF4157)